MRDTARAPQPPTDPLTGHRISLHGLAQIDQKCQFWAKFGSFWAKILIFTGESKCFGTYITEEPPSHLFCIVFWSDMGRNGPTMTIFGQKCIHSTQFGLFGPKMLILTRGSKSFDTHITEKPHRPFVRIVYWLDMGPNGPKMSIFGQKKPIFMHQKVFSLPTVGAPSASNSQRSARAG